MGLDEVYELSFHAVQTSNNDGHAKQNKTKRYHHTVVAYTRLKIIIKTIYY